MHTPWKRRVFPTVGMLLSLLLLAPAFGDDVAGPDTDGDGLSDLLERTLGSDPHLPDTFVQVHRDPTLAEGDTQHAQRRAVPDMTGFSLGNAGGNRWLWRIDFADPFAGSGANLLLYIDADNDPATGRQGGATGTDVRLMYHNGAAALVIQNSRVLSQDRSLRAVAIGNTLYFSMDLNVKLDSGGACDFRARALCQLSGDPRDSDTTDWFPVRGVRLSDRPKRAVGTLSQAFSQGVDVRRPWLGWRTSLAAADGRVLPADAALLEGMKRYNQALEPTVAGARARWEPGLEGAFHITLLLQDSGVGRETIEIILDGDRLAHCTAAQNDGDLYLFSTSSAARFAPTSVLEVVSGAPAQDFRLAEVILSPAPLVPPPLEIRHLEAYCSPLQTTDSRWLDVCFLTSVPCIGGLRFSRGEGRWEELEDSTETYNHRFRISGLAPGQAVRFATHATYGAERAETAEQTALAAPPHPAASAATLRRVPLERGDLLAARSLPWPVSSGIPLPQGELESVRHCRLTDANGTPLAADMSPLAFWPDGSVKWVLLNTVCPPGLSRAVFEYGPAVDSMPGPVPIRVIATAEGVTVQTDCLRASMSRQHVVPLGELWVDADGDGVFADSERLLTGAGPGITLTDADGHRFTSAAGAPTRFEVEEAGPVRTVVCAEGPLVGDHGKYLSYQCRMTFLQGFPGVQVSLTLCVDEGDTIFPPTLHRVSSLTLPLQTAAAPSGPLSRLLQDDANRYIETDRDGRRRTLDGRMSGELQAAVGQQPLTLAIRHARELYPKACSFADNQLLIEPLPHLPPDSYAERTDPRLLTMNYYWFRDGAYLVPCGTRPSTDALLYFGNADPGAVAAAWDAVPVLSPTPDYLAASGAFFDLEPERPGVFDDYARFVRNGFAKVEEQRQRQQWYSWMNFGDWYGERSVNWGNQEYDMQWGLLLQYARTGDPRFLDRAGTAALHTACIDQITWSPDPSRLGIQKEHALWHVGGFNTPRIESATYWFNNGIYNTGHMWSMGTYGMYWISGDRRLKAAMDLLCEWMAGPYCRTLERWVHRNYGWSTLVVLGAYHTDPHPYYLNAARLFMENVISRQDPGTGAFLHPIGECTHTPRHMGGKTFMSGVVMSALKQMDQLEPRDEYKNAIRLAADWMHTRMWDPLAAGFRYAECPQFDRNASSSGINMACEGLAYAVELFGKDSHREMLVQALAKEIQPDTGSASGKGFAMQLRMTAHAFSAMARWGMTDLPEVSHAGADLQLAPETPVHDGQGILALWGRSASRQPQSVSLRLLAAPSGVRVEPTEISWDLTRGTHLSPSLAVRCAETLTDGKLVFEYTLGEQRGTLQTSLKPGRDLRLGDAIAYVGGAGDPVGLALEKIGVTLPRIEALEPTALTRCKALLLGAEAHEKGFAGLPQASHLLLDFVHAGGRVAIIQVQDSSYQGHFLPLPIAFSNTKGAAGAIVKPEHPLFNHPQRIDSLEGLVSYDTIVAAAGEWEVLAKDRQGQPSILETRFGRGRLLLVQPSPDRYILGLEAPLDAATPASGQALLENILAYLGE